LRERWFGATRERVAEIAVEGEAQFPAEPLVLDDLSDESRLRAAFDEGTPVVVRADTAEGVVEALSRAEVACVLVPPDKRDLLGLDLVELTYGA
jgi:hypothetical protein